MKGHNLFSRLFLLAILLAAQTAELDAQCISGNCQNGTGTYRYTGNSKYTGQFLNGLRHGKGKITYPDGNVYEGPFVMGKKQGENGTMTFASNGDKYSGQWKNDQPTGKGKYYFITGERYEGDFVSGTFEGQGTMFYPDGTK